MLLKVLFGSEKEKPFALTPALMPVALLVLDTREICPLADVKTRLEVGL